jgi:hypothetical protein
VLHGAFGPPMEMRVPPAFHSERSEESASYVLLAKTDSSSLRSVERRLVGVRLAVPPKSAALPRAEGTASRTPTVVEG